MTIELSKEDLALIEMWYQAAAGESSSHGNTTEDIAHMKDLLTRLGFELHPLDQRHGNK